MNRNDKPTLVPSLATSGTLAWSAVLVAAFLAVVAVYSAVGRLIDAQRVRTTARPTCVKTPFFKTEIPAGWAFYALDDDDLRLYKNALGAPPLVCYSVSRDEAFRYRALDLNPALTARRLTEHLVALGFPTATNDLARVIATDVVQVDPDVSAIRAQFAYGRLSGESIYFILDDVAYMVMGVWDWNDRESANEIRDRLEYMFDNDDLLERSSTYPRPVVNSAEMTAADHQRVHNLAANERAMWELFAARSESETESVLPAIVHFRKLILLMASIREERGLCTSEAYTRYEKMLERRKAERVAWELLLDKYRGLGDLKKAIAQAAYIAEHAVLSDEALLRQQATRTKAALEREWAAKEGGR